MILFKNRFIMYKQHNIIIKLTFIIEALDFYFFHYNL